MSARSDRPRPLLSFSLDVDCPKCGLSFDISSDGNDPEGRIGEKVFTNQWKEVEGEEVYCPHCEHEFEVGEVEY